MGTVSKHESHVPDQSHPIARLQHNTKHRKDNDNHLSHSSPVERSECSRIEDIGCLWLFLRRIGANSRVEAAILLRVELSMSSHLAHELRLVVEDRDAFHYSQVMCIYVYILIISSSTYSPLCGR